MLRKADNKVTSIATAKYQLDGNQTEWVKYSNETVNMTAKDVVYCYDEDFVVSLGEINGTTFEDATLVNTTYDYSPNINIYAAGYQNQGGIASWYQVLGDPYGNDSYASAAYYSGRNSSCCEMR